MIEAVRQIIPAVVTVTTVNAQITALNTEYSASVPALPGGSIIHCWNKALLDLPRPSIGYTIGFDKTGKVRLQMNQLRKWTVAVWFYVISPSGQDRETAFQSLGITFEALQRVMESFPPNGPEQKQLGVSPVRAIALVHEADARAFTLDATAAGNVVGFAAGYDCEVYGSTT